MSDDRYIAGLADGYAPAGTTVRGPEELERLLRAWLESSDKPTVGEIGSYGGSAVIQVGMGSDEFVLNRDTKRRAVQDFLLAAARVGGARHLPWNVTVNRRGIINRVTYRADREPTPGWYSYLRKAAFSPRRLE